MIQHGVYHKNMRYVQDCSYHLLNILLVWTIMSLDDYDSISVLFVETLLYFIESFNTSPFRLST